MISPVNFTGKLFFDKSVKNIIDKDRKSLQQCAKDNDCDIFILNKNEFKNNDRVYEAIVDKNNVNNNKKDIFSYVFWFKNN